MRSINLHKDTLLVMFLVLMLSFSAFRPAEAATMQDYCVTPPFVSQAISPLVLLTMGRDHKFWYAAYNDAYDLDGDGKIDIAYKHSIDYYGYFDPNRCYTYQSSGSPVGFIPVTSSVATNKFCTTGQWSGNILNYLTTSKMDAVRKIFYGGNRVSGSSGVLERAYIPQDAHSWGKEITGRLCMGTGLSCINSSGVSTNTGCSTSADCPSGSTCSSTTLYTNQCESDLSCDTDNGFSCVDKSVNLIGIAAATPGSDCNPNAVSKVCSVAGTSCNGDTDCLAGQQCVYTRTGQILLLTYDHDSSKTSAANANNHANLVASFEPDLLRSPISYVNTMSTTTAALDPRVNHAANYNYYLITQFQVTAATAGVWTFGLDTNEAAEVEIDGTVVVSRYGANVSCNASCTPPPATGTITLAAGWHTFIVRHFEAADSGSTTQKQDGVRVWYDLPGSPVTWTYFNSPSLNLRAPDIDPLATGNYCSIQTSNFISTGIPETSPYTVTAAKHHLFCNTSLGDGTTYPPLLRRVTDRTERIWVWSAKERPVCNSSGTSGYPFTSPAATPTDYEVRVQTCTAAEAAAKTQYFKNYCRDYPTGSNSGWMPTGLLQKYSEGDGTSVCSKQFTKTCTSNSDCTLATEGECVAKTKMMFGLMTGSYTNNLQGGVLRKNIGSILDEVNASNGAISKTTPNARGNIAMTIDNMRAVGFRYSDYTYNVAAGGTCDWIANGPITNGQCRNWGNPVGEMLYEAERYLAGKQLATSNFLYTTSDDAGLTLSKQGCTSSTGCTNPWIQPYSLYPQCARPFILTFSDISPSFDSDTLPGTSFVGGISTDLPGLNVTTLANTIGTTEGLAGASKFIGQNGTAATNTDFLCTSKTISNLGSVRGICPEEPNKQGTFYSAAMAYYGKEVLKYCSDSPNTTCLADSDCAGGTCTKRNINTYSIALSSPVPDITLKLGGKTVTFIPTGKSVGGCFNLDNTAAQTPKGCACTFTTDGNGLHMSNCQGFCPTAQVVAFFIDRINYDSSGNLTYAKFRVNFEDVEQGADHDMDAIVTYEIAPHPTDPLNRLRVNISSDYSSTCVAMAFGFIVKGTSEDNVYLPVKLVGSTNTKVNALPLFWSKTFTVLGTSVHTMKDPLWYAAKWGGFEDANNSHTPDLAVEWDKDGDGNPDNYFLVVNPLKMEQQLESAILSILSRASSGTAASVLASSEGRGANIIQALFHPKKIFDNDTSVDWAGQLHNLWYYIDPMLQTNTIREDTVQDQVETLTDDWQIQFRFDSALNKTVVDRYSDSDANGTPDTFQGTVEPDSLRSLWEAGDKLFRRNIGTDARTIKTTLTGSAPYAFTNFESTDTAADALAPYLQAATRNEAKDIINYVLGYDSVCTGTTTACTADSGCTPSTTGACKKYRSRTVTKGPTTGVWRLGDIVTSTPKVQTPVTLNNYYTIYKDDSYSSFAQSSNYKLYGTAYTGSNDGMLHAFNFGVFQESWSGQDKRFQPARLTLSDATNYGKERWAFIPKNVLPYLKYLTDANYCHIYSVDASPVIFDAAINVPTGCSGDYWTCPKQTTYQASSTDLDTAQTSWRTVLIGSLRFGGACRGTSTVCTDVSGDGQKDCVNTPVNVTEGGTAKSIGYSSYFALDITDQDNPQLLWEFSDNNIPSAELATGGLGYSTSGPAFMRIAARKTDPGDASKTVVDDTKNGRWFVVLASGPTGPIDTNRRQFLARSDQNLKLFVLDLKTGQLLRTIGTLSDGVTTIPYAFGGSLMGGKMDYDLDYQDDALYFGYTKKCTNATMVTNHLCTLNTWTDGGVLRLVTKEDLNGNNAGATGNTALNPANWQMSTVMSGIGPVSSAIANLVKRSFSGTAQEGWLYYGTGRYFYQEDDTMNQRTLFGIKEPCVYDDVTGSGFHADCTLSRAFCSAPVSGTTDPVSCGDLYNVTTNVQLDPSVLALKSGWYVNIESPTNTNVDGTLAANSNITATAERVMTDPVAVPNGAVFFTTFEPNQDICAFGGNTFLWCLQYNTGSYCTLKGTALLQLSTGEIKELKLKDAFVKKPPVLIPPPGPTPTPTPVPPRRTGAMVGVPPVGQGLSLVISPTPIDKIINIQKK